MAEELAKSDVKEFSYKEAILFSKNKSKYINNLLKRIDSYHKVVEIAAQKDMVVCPRQLLRKFSIIDERYALYYIEEN